MNKKLTSDPFYGPLYQAYPSDELLEDAGFFDDTLSYDELRAAREDIYFLTTPLKLVANIAQAPDHATYTVLVTTGAFSPIHKGHIAMMEAAKKKLDDEGKIVVGGYIIPGHDTYVSVKKNGEAAMEAALRVDLAQQAVAGSQWLMVDPWAAQYAPCELNFTTILQRTEAYLKKHVPYKTIEVFYVFGGDNAGFSKAFLFHGQAVCVSRDGAPKLQKQDVRAIDEGRVYLADSSFSASSTAVRAGRHELLPPEIKMTYHSLGHEQIPSNATYGIRDDSSWALSEWSVDARAMGKALVEGITKQLKIAMPTVPVSLLDLSVQRQEFTSFQRAFPSLLNLDVCMESDNRLGISRVFGMSDYQALPLRFVERPGTPSFDDQIARLSSKSYVYFDDDIASGSTLRYVSELLKAHDITITDSVSCVETDRQLKNGYVLYDIVDARDFLLGAKDAGLVVELPDGSIGRVPYMAPYVNLTTRSKIPPLKIRSLSIALWQLNVELFTTYGSQLTLQDADPAVQKAFMYLGFKKDTLLSAIAEKHLHYLTH